MLYHTYRDIWLFYWFKDASAPQYIGPCSSLPQNNINDIILNHYNNKEFFFVRQASWIYPVVIKDISKLISGAQTILILWKKNKKKTKKKTI